MKLLQFISKQGIMKLLDSPTGRKVESLTTCQQFFKRQITKGGNDMREILFRGKDFGGFWHHGFLSEVNEDCAELLENISGIKMRSMVFKETIGQYTGLTDKNGVKIFEGDIVSAQDETETELYRFVVKFGECGGVKSEQHEKVGFMGFYFEGTITTCVREFFLREDPIYWLNAYKCVIMGNIQDNPGLLEGVV